MELVRLPSGLMVGHHRQLLFAFNNDCADVVHYVGHVAKVTAVAFNDSSLLFSGDLSGALLAWQVKSGALAWQTHRRWRHKGPIMSITPVGLRLVAAASPPSETEGGRRVDGRVTLQEAQTGNLIWGVDGHQGVALAGHARLGLLLSVAASTVLLAFNVSRRDCTVAWGQPSDVGSGTAAPASLDAGGTSTKVGDAMTMGGRRRSAATVAIHAVAADEHRVFSSASDGFIACWSREIGHLVWRVGAPGGATVGVLTLGVSLGQLIAGCDQSVVPISSPGHNRPAAEAQYRVFALSWRTGELQWTADGHSNASGAYVYSSSMDTAILSKWDPANGKLVTSKNAVAAAVNAVAAGDCSERSQGLIYTSQRGMPAFRLFDLASNVWEIDATGDDGASAATPETKEESLPGLGAASRSGGAGAASGSVIHVRPAGGAALPTSDGHPVLARGHTGQIRGLCARKDVVYSVGNDSSLRAWRGGAQQWHTRDTDNHDGIVWCVTEKGGRIFTGGNDSLVKAWDTNGQLLWTCSEHKQMVGCIAASDTTVFSGSEDCCLIARDAATGRLKWRIQFGERQRVELGGGGHGMSSYKLSQFDLAAALAEDEKKLTGGEANAAVELGASAPMMPESVHKVSVRIPVTEAAPRPLGDMSQSQSSESESDSDVPMDDEGASPARYKVLKKKRLVSDIWCVCCSEDGRMVFSGGSDHKLRAFNAEDGTVAWAPARGHEGTIKTCTIQGRTVYTGSMDHTVAAWHAPTGDFIWRSQPVFPEISSIAAHHSRLFVGTQVGIISLDLGSMRRFRIETTHSWSQENTKLDYKIAELMPSFDFFLTACLLVFETVQLAGFAFKPATPPAYVGLQEQLNQAQDFGLPALTYTTVQWAGYAFVAVFAVLFGLHELVQTKMLMTTDSEGWKFGWLAISNYFKIASRALFLPVLTILVRTMDCTTVAAEDGGGWTLDSDTAIRCWEGEHWTHAVLSLLSLAVYGLICVRLSLVGNDLAFVALHWNPFDWASDSFRPVAIHPLSFLHVRQVLVSTLIKGSITLALMMFTTRPTISATIIVVAGVASLTLVVVSPPFVRGRSNTANRIRTMGDAAKLWLYICGLVAAATDSTDPMLDWLPALVLIAFGVAWWLPDLASKARALRGKSTRSKRSQRSSKINSRSVRLSTVSEVSS